VVRRVISREGYVDSARDAAAPHRSNPRARAPSLRLDACLDGRAGLEFFDRHLLPSDATIARMMVGKAAAPDIARATNHSVAFVLARGRQIEEMLATTHDAPPELQRAIHEYLTEKAPRR
jgi:hypothetical protein